MIERDEVRVPFERWNPIAALWILEPIRRSPRFGCSRAQPRRIVITIAFQGRRPGIRGLTETEVVS